MALGCEAVVLAHDFLERGFNTSSASDLGVAFLSLSAAIRGAWLNVLINLGSIKDETFKAERRAKGEALLAKALPLAEAGYEKILVLVQN